MKPSKITDLQLEQFLLNELPDELMRKIRTMIDDDSVLRERVEDLKKSTDEIIKIYPADMMAGKIKMAITSEQEKKKHIEKSENVRTLITPADTSRNIPKRILLSIAAATASAAVAAIIILNPVGVVDTVKTVSDNDIIRIKGMQPGIMIYRKTASSTEQLANMASAKKGDLLQVGYVSTGEYRHGVILSIDGRGTVTLHFPESESGSTILKLNKKVMLERAYELDDSPSCEKFILILSVNPPDIKSIIARAKILAESKDDMLNGKIMPGENNLEFSLTLKK